MLAKPDHPRKKKRGRKPLHPDLRAKSRPPLPPPPPQRHPQPLRTPRDEPRPGVKKPLQPASFTYTGLSRASRDEAASASQTSTSSFSQTAASKPGSLSCVWTNRSLSTSSPSSGSSSHIKTSPSTQSKNSLSELKRSISESGSSRGNGFKVSPLKQGGSSGSLGLHSSFSGGQTSVHRSPLAQRRQEGVGGHIGLVQHKQQNSGLSKPSSSSSSPTPRDQANQALSLRALNLQSVSKPSAGSSLQGNNTGSAVARSSLRSGSGIVIKGGVGGISRTSAGGQRTGVAAGNAAEQGRLRDDRGKEMLAGSSSGRGNGSGRQEERKHGLSSQNRSLNELSTGDSDETSSSESEPDASLYPHNSRPSLGNNATESDTETDWRPARSLLEHVFVTDVTANFITVTVKESPTSVGFFNSRNHWRLCVMVPQSAELSWTKLSYNTLSSTALRVPTPLRLTLSHSRLFTHLHKRFGKNIVISNKTKDWWREWWEMKDNNRVERSFGYELNLVKYLF